MYRVYMVSAITLGVLFCECTSVTVLPIPHGKVVYRRKQDYEYGSEVNHFKPQQLEYKGYYNTGIQQKPAFQNFYQQFPQKDVDIKQHYQHHFNNQYQHQQNSNDDHFKQQEPLALFVSKPEEQNFLNKKQPLFDNAIVKTPETQKALDWESFKMDTSGGLLKQDFESVLQKPPETNFNNYNYQQSVTDQQRQYPVYPPVNQYHSGLKQPEHPVNFYVGFDDYKQNAVQQPAEAAKQNFNAANLPKLQQSASFPYQQHRQEDLPIPSINHNQFGGYLLEPGVGQQQQQQQQYFGQTQQLIGHDNFKSIDNQNPRDLNNQQQQGYENLFAQIPKFTGNQIQINKGTVNEFKNPSEDSMLKFSNEDAVEPQEVGKVHFRKEVNFNHGLDFGNGNVHEDKRENGKKKKSKRLRYTREPQYTYIIRARKHRD